MPMLFGRTLQTTRLAPTGSPGVAAGAEAGVATTTPPVVDHRVAQEVWNDFRQPRAPSTNRGDPNPGQRNSTNFGGARPKTNMQRSYNNRPSRSAQSKQYSMPTWELSDTNPEPLDWNETPQMPSVTHPNTNPPDYSTLRGIDNHFFTPDLVKRIAEAYDGLNKY